jgi:hypothetical protein
MVKELSAELKKAEIAAKKTALASEKGFKEISKSADQAARSTGNLRRQSRELGGAISATGDLVGELDPALGSAVVTIQMAGMAVRDLGKALLTGNPYILAAVIAIAALTAAYAHFTASAKEIEESQNRLAESIKKANERVENSKKAFDNANSSMNDNVTQVNDLRVQYQLLTGALTETEIAEFKLANQASNFADKAQKDLEAQRRALFEREAARNSELLALEAHKQTLQDNNKLYKTGNELTTRGKEIEEAIAEKRKELRIIDEEQLDIKQNGQARVNQLSYEYRELLEGIAKRTKMLEKLEKKREIERANAAEAAKQIAASISKKKADDDRKEAARLATNQKLQGTIDRERLKAVNLDNQNRAARIALIDDENKRNEARLKLEKDIIDQAIGGLEKQKAANIALATTEEQIALAKAANLEIDNQISEMKESLAIKEQALSKQRMKGLGDEANQNKITGEEIAGFYVQAANATSELIKTATNENKQAALVAFRVAQAAAIAEIAINTAKNIVEVGTNPFAIAAVSALGVAQAATVALQKPPEFHMEGMIGKGEDTTQITALRGEAVLDRRTVNRLGGERGVDALQRGQNPNSNQVIVIQPYKHFDRFVRSNQKRGGIMSKLNKVKSAGAY